LQEIKIKPIVQFRKHCYGRNLRLVKAVRRDERFLSLTHADKFYHELKSVLFNKHAHRDFTSDAEPS